MSGKALVGPETYLEKPVKAAEFNTVDEGPVAKATFQTFQDWGALDFKIKYMAQDENSGRLNFDIKRMVRSHNTYNRFPHRLGHDPMSNLASTSTNGSMVVVDGVYSMQGDVAPLPELCDLCEKYGYKAMMTSETHEEPGAPT